MIKLLIGGSPCQDFSIANRNRTVKAEGKGWELFKNYLIAKEKFKPDFFLYENNKSAAQAIKDLMACELGVGVDPQARFTYINSALVSAQKRQRFYITNFGDIEQPKDRQIYLKDILDNPKYETTNLYEENGKCTNAPQRIGSLYENVQGYRIYGANGKSLTLSATGGGLGATTGLYAIPVNTADDDKSRCLRSTMWKDTLRNLVANDYDKRTCVAEPLAFQIAGTFGKRIAVADNKAYCLAANPSSDMIPRCIQWLSDDTDLKIKDKNKDKDKDIKTIDVYEAKDGIITVKGKQYPIKLTDGFYHIRKLSVTECHRLQTMPIDYCKSVSNSQAYKCLGNSWTAEVIIHLLNHALKDVPKNEKIVVLSMYDGIATGRYCLDKMGFTNVEYHAYEIDKYPITVAMDNYPDIIQHGDTFALRNDDWTL
jgi:DNA (cytosine-5)-methyltransferase 3A